MLWSSVKITSYLFSLFFNFSCGVVVECENHFVLLSVPERTSLASYTARRNWPSGAAAPDPDLI